MIEIIEYSLIFKVNKNYSEYRGEEKYLNEEKLLVTSDKINMMRCT